MAEINLCYGDHTPTDPKGSQRLSVERLQTWQAMEYGMFIHYGLVTYNHDLTTIAPSDFRPPGKVDTDQWARVARDAGMKYAIWIAQHTCSMCMWDTKIPGVAGVMDSPAAQDVTASFIESCNKYGIIPCLYFSGSRHTPWYRDGGFVKGPDDGESYIIPGALDAVRRQLDELLTQYGPVAELWIDGGASFGQYGRSEVYHHAASLQPEMVITFNGWGHDLWRLPRFHRMHGWPSDILTLEVLLPPFGEISPWRKMSVDAKGQKLGAANTGLTDERGALDMYIPVGSYMVIQRNFNWFHDERAELVDDADLLGMRLICKARHANLVLNVAPDHSSRIPDDQVGALMRLRENSERVHGHAVETDITKGCVPNHES